MDSKKKDAKKVVARLVVETLERRFAPISIQGLSAIAEYRPAWVPPFDPPPDLAGH